MTETITKYDWLPKPKQPKSCGDCSVCCSIMQVQELGKPMWSPCQHCTSPGCGIYPDRPASCSGWSCDWLTSNLPDDLRPDKLGLMIAHNRHGELQLFEAYADAFTDEKAKQIGYWIRKKMREVQRRLLYVEIDCILIRHGEPPGRWTGEGHAEVPGEKLRL